MNRRLRFAALLPLLLLTSRASAEDPPAPAPAPQDVPKAAPRTPLPPEPKDAGKKAIQAILKRWFENEPKVPVKGKTEADCKSERAKATSDLETEIMKWPNCLRLTAWWKARLEETQPSENKPAGSVNPKVEFVYGEGQARKSYTFAVSVPKTYRGNVPELLPVIVTVIDKGADAKKVLTEAYGKLLDTHIVVAGYEDKVPNAGTMIIQIYYAYLTYHCDRDRVALDGFGKGARFVETLATEDYSTLQWNGVVIRTPAAVQPLEKNLGLFPVAVVDAGTGEAAKAHVAAGAPGSLIPTGDAGAVQAFLAGLPPRKVADQKNTYEMYFKSLGHMPKWGYWFLLKQSVDGGKDLPVRVKISRDPEYNAVDIDASNLAEGVLLLNDEILDLEQPVAVRVNGILVAREKIARTLKETFSWDGGYATFLIGPRNYFIVAALPFVVPEGDARIPKADRDAAAAAEKKAAEDRKKQEDADAAAAEAQKKAEEEAKNPKPEPVPGDKPPATDGTVFFGSLDEAKAADRKRPILVIFKAPAGDGRQIALDVALASEAVKKALAAVDIVQVPAAEAGDAGKATRDLLAATSGAADTAVPFLAVYGVKATLALAGLKDEEVEAAVLKLLAGLVPPPARQEVPTPFPWGEDYEAGRRAALERKVPLVVYFRAVAEEKGPALPEGQQAGQTAMDAVVKDHPAVTALLAKAVCVRLNVGGAEKDKVLAVLATVSSTQTAPCLWGVKVDKSAKDELVNTTCLLLDPVNKSQAEIAEKLVKQLGECGLTAAPATASPPAIPAAPPSDPPKPAEPKPGEKTPEGPKPVDPKPADPK